VYIYNELGKQIYLEIEKSSNEINIDGFKLKPGIYFIELREYNQLIGRAKVVRE